MKINLRNIVSKFKTKAVSKKPKRNLDLELKEIYNKEKVITNPKKIAKIKNIFQNTKNYLNELKKVSNPIKERKLRQKILSDFEKNLEKQDFLISFQKISGVDKNATALFLDILAEDYNNFLNKEFAKEENAQEVLRVIYNQNNKSKTQLRQETEIYISGVNNFISGKADLKQFSKYSAKVPVEIKKITKVYR